MDFYVFEMLRCTKIRDFNELQKYCLQINVDRILNIG